MNFFKLFTEFKDDAEIYVYPSLKYVGIELWQVILLFYFYLWIFLSFGLIFSQLFNSNMWWYACGQVKSGTLFDNVLITDDAEYAKKLAEETWAKNKDVCYLALLLFPVKSLFSYYFHICFDF